MVLNIEQLTAESKALPKENIHHFEQREGAICYLNYSYLFSDFAVLRTMHDTPVYLYNPLVVYYADCKDDIRVNLNSAETTAGEPVRCEPFTALNIKDFEKLFEPADALEDWVKFNPKYMREAFKLLSGKQYKYVSDRYQKDGAPVMVYPTCKGKGICLDNGVTAISIMGVRP